jgi:hypothetical protein
MPYVDHFQLADDYLAHLDTVIVQITDPFIKSRYTGFLAVSAVTVYELAIKTIFIEFANRKHHVLGNFTAAYFDRINGRIKTDIIRDDYIKKFGERYVKRFRKKLEEREQQILKSEKRSVKSSYANIITWRNGFAHEGQIQTVATYEEVKLAYVTGKHLIHCLADTMSR